MPAVSKTNTKGSGHSSGKAVLGAASHYQKQLLADVLLPALQFLLAKVKSKKCNR